MDPKAATKQQAYQVKDWVPEGSKLKRHVDGKEISQGYKSLQLTDLSTLFFSAVIAILGVVYYYYYKLQIDFEMFQQVIQTNIDMISSLELDFIRILLGVSLIAVLLTLYYVSHRPVYLVDFAICQPPAENKVSFDTFISRTRSVGKFTDENAEFQERILSRAGVGPDTYFPDGIIKEPTELTMESARKEFEYVMTNSLDDLFERTGLKPKDIDILIVNCSLFNPTPSLAAMIINKYKMKSTIKSYNLSGMGCSAGVISIDLAKDLLQVHPNSNCLVVSTENITQNWYLGNDRSMLLSNCLFRMGGAAVLLSNKPKDAYRAKYRLMHTVRICKAANDEAYEAVFQCEDAKGIVGVRLSKQLIRVVGDALKSNMTLLGPLVLPWSEQIKFFLNMLKRKAEKFVYGKTETKTYTPDFKKAFDHVCIHAGGRAVIDGMEQNLNLSKQDVKASRAVLWRYGNTSSSSIWYELAYHEHSGTIRKGERVWQIAFGSGFKCNSAVWKSLKSIHDKNRGDWNLEGSGIEDEQEQ